MTTNVPAIQWTPTGPVLPTEAQILAGVQQDQNAAFGGNLNPGLTTPQGQLATSLAAILADANSNLALIASQLDPDQASDRWQDAIGRLYYLTRNPAQGTALELSCIGLVGTPIPIGFTVTDESTGLVYAATQAGQIPTGGSLTLSFVCTTTGPTAVPAAVQPTKVVPGLDSTAVVSGVVGSDVESRTDFEIRRRNSVAANANGSVQAVRGAVLALPGVLDCYAIDNPTSGSVTSGAITLPPNSIYVCVAGGTAAQIANAIWTKKSGGCGYVGNQSLVIYDTNGYYPPYPEYAVQWQSPSALPLFYNVQIKNNPNLPATYVSDIQNAIIGAAAGADGGQPLKIAATVYASRYYQPVGAVDPAVEVVSIQLGTTSGSVNQNYIGVGIDQVPTVTAANIAVSLV